MKVVTAALFTSWSTTGRVRPEYLPPTVLLLVKICVPKPSGSSRLTIDMHLELRVVIANYRHIPIKPHSNLSGMPDPVVQSSRLDELEIAFLGELTPIRRE
jgi:hypothetical protein